MVYDVHEVSKGDAGEALAGMLAANMTRPLS